jgi:hypothetical protein
MLEPEPGTAVGEVEEVSSMSEPHVSHLCPRA